MKAIIQKRYGGPDTLELVKMDQPKLKSSEVLIKIHSTNIASGDMRVNTLSIPFGLKTIMRLVFGWNGPRNKIRGLTAAGEIIEVGDKTTKFKVGDRVNFINSMGASCLAEYISLNEKKIISKIGNDVSYAQAAPVSFGAMSAYHFINENTIKKGDEVLIYGASGSVGSYALQLAIYYGATVTAVCSKKNHAAVKKLGAKHVINYKTTDFSKTSKKYDVIFDAVIKIKKKQVKSNLKEKGRFMSIKLPTSEKQDRLDLLNKLMQEGNLVSLMDKEFKFVEYKEAHELVYSQHKLGNVVINIIEE